ncbi:oplophorus-luciferin 2-monooxygenase non-catalytic subunit isoform X1 [Penaeus vannamei]|uniref:oplophorus-luciferin 2-monooxygenase non-catalytic subunit isoform X1 n=2 Tax=Penaeus vannamei TaxID=6689 RepID=UPI000F66F188|nr:chondroadherin-like isoform X1 [Penaeus vannamei]
MRNRQRAQTWSRRDKITTHGSENSRRGLHKPWLSLAPATTPQHLQHLSLQMFRGVVCVAVVAACLTGALAACPSGITPCTCREETQGRIMDCTKASSSADLVKVFQTDMGDSRFDYFQVVPLDGHSTLEALPANVFGGKTFIWLWIGQTDIASVDPDAFAGMEGTLVDITLADSTKLTAFPFGSVDAYQSLYKVFLSNTQITKMEPVAPAPNLAEVSVPGSQIASVAPNAFADLPRLARVDLSRNPLTALEDDWFAAATSEPWVLYLDNCDIADISPGAFSGSLPAGLFLNGNKMTSIPEATFRPLLENMASSTALVHYVDLNKNPLECDCAVQWIAQDATLSPFVRNAVCSNGEVAGTPIQDLPADFFGGC